MELNNIKNQFSLLSEEKYRNFSLKLTNNSSLPMIGVRLPQLRQLAKKIKKDEKSLDFMQSCDFSSIEMCLLYSYVLGGYSNKPIELLVLFDKAAANVDNWCTCDILCQSFKQCEKFRDETWEKIIAYLETGKTYYMRISVVMMMSHFLTDEYIDRVLNIISVTKNDDYYYKMGAAWVIATAMAKYRDKTFDFLETCQLDEFTFNKAIQKMCESRRVNIKDKEVLRKLKKKSPINND